MLRGKLWLRPLIAAAAGRTPFKLARMAEPLLSSAVNDG